MEIRARFKGETFTEWRRRLNEWRWRRPEKVAALKAEYDAAPVIPLRASPGEPEVLRRCRKLGGVYSQFGRYSIVDAKIWKQAEREVHNA